MEQIKNEKELLDKLKNDVSSTDKKIIVLFSGHFPLVYDRDDIEAFDRWAAFSPYTLELVSQIGKYAKENGKVVKFVFFVDDHAYENWGESKESEVKKKRRALYQLRSGKDAKLPELYRNIMVKYGFDETDVIRHDQGKEGRKDCLYFSEKILRASKRQISNDCAREYTDFIENPEYFDKKNMYLITFGPNRCKDNICSVALDQIIKDLSSSHVFLETMGTVGLAPEKLYTWGRGVSYRKD